MSKANLALVQQSESASGREDLAAAIAAWAERSAEITAIQKAVSVAGNAWQSACDRREEAAAAIEPARVAAAEHAIAVAMGTAGDAPLSIKAARAALIEAEDDEATAKSALDALQGRLEDRTRFAYVTQVAVGNAACEVLKGATAGLVAEIAELQQRLVDRGAALIWLANNNALDLSDVAVERGRDFGPAKSALDRLHAPAVGWHRLAEQIPAEGGAAPWKAAMEALKTNANAELPK